MSDEAFALVLVAVIAMVVWWPVVVMETRQRRERFERELELRGAMWEAQWWWEHGRPRPHR